MPITANPSVSGIVAAAGNIAATSVTGVPGDHADRDSRSGA